jgi:hypothetical protein
VRRRDGLDRLRAYGVLRDLWALGKWIEHDPALTDAQTWEPVTALIDDTHHASWVDQLLAAGC